MALLSLAACNQQDAKNADSLAQDSVGTAGSDSSKKAFEEFTEHFSATTSFAYSEVSGRKVLFVSQETFGDEDNPEKEAIEATIFALDNKAKIISLGSIRSQGTLYPVSLLDGKLMVAGHQFVRVYSIRGDVPELVLDTCQEGDGPEMTEWFRTFEKGTSVKFKKWLK